MRSKGLLRQVFLSVMSNIFRCRLTYAEPTVFPDYVILWPVLSLPFRAVWPWIPVYHAARMHWSR